jgi:4-hydroxy-3-polyprenylbenzoate decarboxylase
MKLIVALTGASGVIYGFRLLEVLADKVETHLILSKLAERNLALEMDKNVVEVKRLANYFYDFNDLSAPIASGTFKTDGMVIVPCSMKTLASIACGYADNLITRAADVTLKEKRKLVLVPRETPLSIIHLKNLLRVAEAGAIVLPPVPAFYNKPKTVDEIVNYVVGKILDCLGIEHELFKRWKS